MKRMKMVLLLLTGVVAASAQPIPVSNIYLFELRQPTDSTLELTKPRYLTAFNPNGYNNHPAFFNENELCVSVQLPTERQPELYLLNLNNNTKTRLTQTPEGEYSPSLMPNVYAFSAVRQEITLRDTALRLWEFPIDLMDNGKPVFKYFKNIGYYHWLNSAQVAVFLTTNPNQLAIANVRDDKLEGVATNVGRCFRLMPNGNLVYVKKDNIGPWKLMQRKMNTGSNAGEEITNTIPGAEDFAVLQDGSILMGKGSKLYRYNPRSARPAWREVADLRFYNINNITRLAISADMKLALVCD
jgi:hypothetical protein